LAHIEVGPDRDLLPPFGDRVTVYDVAVDGTKLRQIVIASVERQITSELPCCVAGPPIVFPPADNRGVAFCANAEEIVAPPTVSINAKTNTALKRNIALLQGK